VERSTRLSWRNYLRTFLLLGRHTPAPLIHENSTANLNRGLESGAIRFSFTMKSTKSLTSKQREQLLQAARKVMIQAHAPYSRFRVGAALLTANNEIFSGCNVENASYGLTNCAERTAIFAAVAQSGPNLNIRAVAVVNDQGVPCSPCGACRQVIYEFGPDAIIIFQSAKGWKVSHITELLPEGFRL
jgi:cytidine deaminase